MAPEVYWETGKPVLGGPYDRNIEGLTDLFQIEWDGAPYDKAYELLKKHQVELLFLQNPRCLTTMYYDDDKKDYKPDLDHYFHGAAYYGTKNSPKWLKLEHLDKKTNIKIFRIIDKPEPRKKKK